MASVHRLPSAAPAPDDGVFAHLARLLRLELELGMAEAHDLIVSAVIAIAIAVPAAILLLASLVVLGAAAFAPLFGARWEHLVIAGGGVGLLAAMAIAWSAWRLRSLGWPRQTLNSFRENWRWLAAQTRSRLTLR